MKKQILTLVLFSLTLCVASAFAQSATRASRQLPYDTTLPQSDITKQLLERQAQMDAEQAEVDAFMHRSPIEVPERILDLVRLRKYDEADKEFQNYKSTQQASDPLDLLIFEAEFYMKALHEGDSANPYAPYQQARAAIIQKMQKSYANRAAVIRYEMDTVYEPARIVEICDRMIKAEPSFLPAYYDRGIALYALGKTKEFCNDFDRLPEAVKRSFPIYGMTCLKFK